MLLRFVSWGPTMKEESSISNAVFVDINGSETDFIYALSAFEVGNFDDVAFAGVEVENAIGLQQHRSWTYRHAK